jgi:hypothetical protein
MSAFLCLLFALGSQLQYVDESLINRRNLRISTHIPLTPLLQGVYTFPRSPGDSLPAA